MNSQQEADCALGIWQANRGDQERIDSLLKQFFAQVRADEYEQQIELVRGVMSCVSPETTNSSSSLPSLEASLSAV